MDDQNKNLILATALSFLVILVWFVLFPPEQAVETVVAPASTEATQAGPTADTSVVTGENTATSAVAATPSDQLDIASAPRVTIDTPRLEGSISLLGGRIDDLRLKGYRETLDAGSDIVTLLSPVDQSQAYYSLFGWAPGGDLGFDDVPNKSTLWQATGPGNLTPQTPVTLTWSNGKGLTFTRTIEIDENYLFSVTQNVENGTEQAIRLAPSIELVRHGEPDDLKNFFVLHEGAVRQSGEELNEIDYDDIVDYPTDDRWGARSEVVNVTQNGWIGFTDHFWMTTIVPDANQPFESVLKYDSSADTYRAIARLGTLSVEPGASSSATTQLFAGAKEWETIRNYERDQGIFRFIDSIDWGWFFFLTKPIFAVLHWLNSVIGNMGWAIIGLTLIIKAVLFPLAYKSYVSMAKMKELQPEMEKLKEAAGDDRQKMQQGMMELYRKNKVNPASGCLPILLQIPIFFSLYKVIFVTLELRHAPWIGWIQDLSAPDPSSILNLFGLLPYATPEPSSIFYILSLGILPILLGISMWIQQKLNPAPTDPTQAMIFAWMPWVFMFMLGSFASGLVLYWIANNTITFTQQYIIMRSQGYKPDVFGNMLSSFKRKKPDKK